jgi:hypothetical protein
MPPPGYTEQIDLDHLAMETNTNAIFIIVVAARSAVASPNMSTIGNKFCYLLHSSDWSPAWHLMAPRLPS